MVVAKCANHASPRTLNDFDQQTVSGAANALLPVMPDINSIIHSVIQGCLDHKGHSNDLQ